MSEQPKKATLYARLGGYDAIAAVADDLLPRLMAEWQLQRFLQHPGGDGVRREEEVVVDFLCGEGRGAHYYTGRDMLSAHRGMRINESDWTALLTHVKATLEKFAVPARERGEVLAFVESTKKDIVE